MKPSILTLILPLLMSTHAYAQIDWQREAELRLSEKISTSVIENFRKVGKQSYVGTVSKLTLKNTGNVYERTAKTCTASIWMSSYESNTLVVRSSVFGKVFNDITFYEFSPDLPLQEAPLYKYMTPSAERKSPLNQQNGTFVFMRRPVSTGKGVEFKIADLSPVSVYADHMKSQFDFGDSYFIICENLKLQ